MRSDDILTHTAMVTSVTVPRALEIAAEQLDRGAWQRAEEICREILRADPNNSEAEFLLGKALAAQGRHEEALVSHERSLWLRPVVRWHVIQAAIAWCRAKTYLEIGVAGGDCFCRIMGPKKLGVDPVYPGDSWGRQVQQGIVEFFAMTSDEFFARHGDKLQGGIDVAFIDGLHTYEQSLADVQQCLPFLNQGGLILMHDCNPTSEAMAAPASSYGNVAGPNHAGPAVEWTGDVWKTIVHLRSTAEDLSIAVLDCDYGVGAIVKRPMKQRLSVLIDTIRSWTYHDLEANRKDLLNLQPPQALFKMLRGG
jgi:hypothetical protein